MIIKLFTLCVVNTTPISDVELKEQKSSEAPKNADNATASTSNNITIANLYATSNSVF